jgi:hypothetical protein
MTEAEWLTGTRPLALLGYLIDERQRGRYPDRVFRSLAVAVARRLDPRSLDRRSRKALEVAEKFARGETTSHELERAQRGVHEGMPRPDGGMEGFAACCAVAVTGVNGVAAAWDTVQLIKTVGPLLPSLLDALPDLIREVFGNPFHTPTLPAHWRVWNEGTIARLARHAHEQRRFDEMPVLGDALEDAGCVDEQTLAHCRSATPHVLGCWVLELLLAEE